MESIKLNLIPSGVNPTCHCSQYDNGRLIRIDLFDGLTPYALQANDVVTLNVRKPDNTIVTTTVSSTQGNTYVNIETTEQICAVVGFNLCDLTITNGTKVIGTLNFIMAVERDVLADGIPSQSVIEDLDARVQEAVGDNYYTKSEVDDALDLKADKSDTYTKMEVESKLLTKANIANVYTKAQTDNLLDAKADKSTTYTKIQVDIALEGKADIDGTYDDMTVGNAKQLVSTVTTEDKVPYNFRTSGGSADIGDRETDTVVGGTLAFNQLVQNGNFASVANWTKYSGGDYTVSNNVASLSGANGAQISQDCPSVSTRKYLFVGIVKGDGTNGVGIAFDNASPATLPNVTSANWTKVEKIISGTGTKIRIHFKVVTAETSATVYISNVNLIDLTQMFGSTIADYIYSLEQATAGAGVAWFRSLFPKSYYAYNAGELMSVKTSDHIMVGFNAYNNATGKAKLLGGVEYQITGSYTSLAYTDINGDSETITPDSSGYFTPTNNGELTVSGGNATDTCIHIVWDGERDGDFEPYELNSYELDPDLELRGIAKLDADNKLYYDGDTYESDGTVTRRYGIVDLGSLSYQYNANTNIFTSTNMTNFKEPTTTSQRRRGFFCSKIYLPSSTVAINADMDDKSMLRLSGQINIRNTSYTDETTFKTAMSGVYLVYELATPTTETADSYQNPQIVDDFGTEEYVDTRAVPIPVGHDTLYQVNLRAKLEMAPESPSGNGDYIVRQTNGINSYVPLVIPSELPDPPTTDGTYRLTVTVSGGVASYSWVSV